MGKKLFIVLVLISMMVFFSSCSPIETTNISVVQEETKPTTMIKEGSYKAIENRLREGIKNKETKIDTTYIGTDSSEFRSKYISELFNRVMEEELNGKLGYTADYARYYVSSVGGSESGYDVQFEFSYVNRYGLVTTKLSEIPEGLKKAVSNQQYKFTVIYIGNENLDNINEWLEETSKNLSSKLPPYEAENFIATQMELQHDNLTGLRIVFNIKTIEDKNQSDYVKETTKEIIKSIIKSDMTDKEKILTINKYICDTVKYDETTDYLLLLKKHSAYKALKEGLSVCSGYAMLGYRMLEESGFKTGIVSSNEMNHAWNVVMIDGVRYHIDFTWNDTGENKTKYILLTDKQMSKTHTWKSSEIFE